MPKLTVKNVDLLLRGASVLACGGGLPYVDQKKLLGTPRLKKLLSTGVPLLNPQQLADDQYFATVSEVGSAQAPVMSKEALPKALKELEEKTGRRVAGLIPGEIGQESIILEAAAVLDLPIVATDLSGSRAVPRLSDLALVVQGAPFTMSPLVVLQRTGEKVYLAAQKSLAEDEAAVRKLVPSNEVVTILGGLITGADIKRFLPYRSYETAQKIGRSLESGSVTNSLFPTKVLFFTDSCTITGIQEEKAEGFDRKKIRFSCPQAMGSITVENEYMEAEIGAQHFAFPQLIMLIDPKKRRGLHSGEVQKNQKVILVIADAFAFWKEKKV